MCRMIITIAVGLVALGLGLLLATLFPACALIVLISLALIALGVWIFRKGT